MLKNIEEAKALAAKWLRADEKYSALRYFDPGDGSPRIGFGSACPEEMTECEWIVAERLMAAKLEECAEDVYDFLGPKMTPDFRRARLSVLYCMAYQLGGSGLRGFDNMRRAIQADDHDTAANEMLLKKSGETEWSEWRKQTPARCQRLAAIYRRGKE